MTCISPKQSQKNDSAKTKWTFHLGLLCLALLLPAGALAQEGQQVQQGAESSMYQESYQQDIATPYQQESFQQNQFSYGAPANRRPAFNNFYGAEERAYRSREEMRQNKERDLQRELIESELKQRQLDLQNQQQASGLQGYGQGGGSPFGGFVEPSPPIIVNNQNNTEVIIRIGKDKDGNIITLDEDSDTPIQSDVTVIQEGEGNNTLVDIQK